MTKPTQDKETLREAVARIIAAELGDDFDAAFVDKAAWISARGYSGGRFRDVNEPFQRDYLDAADAAIATMFERLRTPSEGMLEASKPFRKGVGETAGRIWQAMLDAFEHGNDHEWEYTGTDPHGSHKGERAYRCKKCKAFEYRPDGEQR